MVLVKNGEDLSEASNRGDGEEEADRGKTEEGEATKACYKGVMEDER